MSHCPNCKGYSRCGCRSCIKRKKQLEPVDVWIDKEIGVIACGHCGFAMIGDAWMAMDCDMHMPSFDYTGDTPVEIPGSTITFEEACEKYRPMGKMPGEPNYRPSFVTHWRVKLWRWRAITGHIVLLLFGRGLLYKKTRRATIAAKLRSL